MFSAVKIASCMYGAASADLFKEMGRLCYRARVLRYIQGPSWAGTQVAVSSMIQELTPRYNSEGATEHCGEWTPFCFSQRFTGELRCFGQRIHCVDHPHRTSSTLRQAGLIAMFADPLAVTCLGMVAEIAADPLRMLGARKTARSGSLQPSVADPRRPLGARGAAAKDTLLSLQALPSLLPNRLLKNCKTIPSLPR